MNERICATALYYLDSDNVTPSHLSFRTQTSPYQEDLQAIASQDNYNWLERFYGTALGPSAGATNACLQYYGSTETREGRLLAFPNTLCVPTYPSQTILYSSSFPFFSQVLCYIHDWYLTSNSHPPNLAANTAYPPSSSKIPPDQATDDS